MVKTKKQKNPNQSTQKEVENRKVENNSKSKAIKML